MRKTMIAVMLCVSLPACGGQVAEEGASSLPTEGAGGAVFPGAPIVTGKGSGTGGPSGSAASSAGTSCGGTSSGTTGGGPWSGATPSCVFGVSGAVEAWVDGPSAGGWTWNVGGGMVAVQCSGSVDGVQHGFDGQFGPLQGPGQYASYYAAYDRSACGSTTNYGGSIGSGSQPAAATCTFELTDAPDGVGPGAAIAGTFYCGTLTGDTDPSRAVTIYAGSFAGTLQPIPD